MRAEYRQVIIESLRDPMSVEALALYLKADGIHPMKKSLPGETAVRQAAASALSNIKDEKALLLIISLTEDDDWHTRLLAAIALSERLEDPRAILRLYEMAGIEHFPSHHQWVVCPETGDIIVSFADGEQQAQYNNLHYFNVYELIEAEPP